MNEVIETPTEPQIVPVCLRPTAERHAHVALRLLDRAGISWTPEQVAALETKIRMVQGMLAAGKPVVAILPRKLADDKQGSVQYWRTLIATKPHTFVWSTMADGLISYRGPGEMASAHVRIKGVSS